MDQHFPIVLTFIGYVYLESKRTESESPTEYNVNVLTLASREITSSPVVKKAPLPAETPRDSPAKNTRRAGQKRYYEEIDHDEDSEEDFKPHMGQGSSDEGTDVAAASATKPKAKPKAMLQLKKQRHLSPSKAVARPGGTEVVEDSSMSSTSVGTIHLLQDLPPEGLAHNMELRVQKLQKKFTLSDVEEDPDEELDDEYLYKGYAEEDLNLDSDEFLSLDTYEVELMKRNNTELTAATVGNLEEDADEDAVDPSVDVGIPVDLAEQREIHKRDFFNLYLPYYQKTSNTHLITDAKYNEIVKLLRTKAKTTERGNTRKLRQTYELVGNVENRCLYRKGKVVTTFERVFDVILEAHSSIGHSRDPRKHKDYLKDTLNYFGIPGPAVQMFINTCPTVSVVVRIVLLNISLTYTNIYRIS